MFSANIAENGDLLECLILAKNFSKNSYRLCDREVSPHSDKRFDKDVPFIAPEQARRALYCRVSNS